MSFRSQVSRRLDEEHRLNLELLGRIEHAFAGGARPRPGDEFARLLSSFAEHVEEHVWRHFDFEEQELFPRLAEAGESELGELLAEEHASLRAVADELLPLARTAATGTLDPAGFDALKRASLEMAERLAAHINKETMALLPMIDDVLDETVDREVAFAYMEG